MRYASALIAGSFAIAMSVAAPAGAQQYGPAPLQNDPYAGQGGYYADPNGGYAQPQPQYDPNAVNYASPDDAALANYDDGYDPQAAANFEPALAPYGTWMDTASYGRVWCPSPNAVGADFIPYGSNGHWAYTEDGWTWVSDYDWGWAPFHYGRWVQLDTCGWSWIPGSAWAPAWVAWRHGGGYVGWAPLPPAGIGLGAYGVAPWRFIPNGQLGVVRPAYVPAASVWGQTAFVPSVRVVNVGGVAVRVPAGPVGAAFGMIRPVPLASIAPAMAPRAAIVPRIAMPVQSRPWIQARVPGAMVAPMYNAPRPAYAAPPVYNGAPVYNAPRPAYAAPPVYNNAPVYNAPRPAYAAPPVYNNAPMYNAPRPAYAAPPAYNAPMYNAPRPAFAAPPGGGYARPAYGGFRGRR